MKRSAPTPIPVPEVASGGLPAEAWAEPEPKWEPTVARPRRDPSFEEAVAEFVAQGHLSSSQLMSALESTAEKPAHLSTCSHCREQLHLLKERRQLYLRSKTSLSD